MSFSVNNQQDQNVLHVDETHVLNDEANFPKSLENLEVMPSPFPDTSTEVFLVKDKETGKSFVVKYHSDPKFIENEYHANRACHTLGLSVPNAKLLKGNWEGKEGAFLVLEFLEGAKEIRERLTGNPELDREICNTLAKDFIVSSLFGLWDVVGLCFNNILFVDNQHYYIDHGLAFGYMHNGKTKSSQEYLTNICSDSFKLTQASDWWETGNFVPEIIYLRDFGDRLGAAYLYQFLSTEDIQGQINALDLTPLRLLTEQGKFPRETFEVIQRRANWLKSVNLKDFEAKWKQLAEVRAKAVSAAGEGKTPVFTTRGMEVVPSVEGGCFSQIAENEDPENRPPKVGVIYREVSKENIWLAKNEEMGKYSFLTWDAKDPTKNYVWEITIGAGRRSGTRVRLSDDFISSNVNDTRYYVVDRMGGSPKDLECFSTKEAQSLLEGSDRELLMAYLNSSEQKKDVSTSAIKNITPT